MIVIHLDRLASYQGAARDERPYGESGCSGWRIVAARREDRLQKTSRAQSPEGRNGDAPLGYSGRIALRREQCDMSARECSDCETVSYELPVTSCTPAPSQLLRAQR
jgi:hypothetical protein